MLHNLDTLYDAFAAVWHFPPWFGRNYAAFDDFIRDLDNMIDAALGKPPAGGYLTEVVDADQLLVDEPQVFPWFVERVDFYRGYYRDEADPPAAFGLLLSGSLRRTEPRSSTLAIGRCRSRDGRCLGLGRAISLIEVDVSVVSTSHYFALASISTAAASSMGTPS
ncbi:barstar family protein [Mycobacterium sp. 050134]|uniref:barstar family protein n=1 Tax=Mycobacterium sp. 050134 TaxID=3096111 RepID=UPI002EDA07C2